MRRVNAARDRLTAAVSPVMVLAAGLSVGPDAASASPAPDVVADWRPRQVVNLDYKDSRSVEEYSELGMTADGTAVAVWNRQVGRRLLVEGARKPSGGDWSQPTVLARTEAVGSAGQTDLFVDAAGNATVGYSDYLGTGTNFRSLVRTWRADGTVGPATELDRGTLVFGPLLYGDADGDVLAVVGNGGDRPDTYYRPFGEPWSDRDAFLARTNPTIADFVLGPGSEVLTVWSDVGGSGGAGEVLSAHLDENGWTSQGAIGSGPGEAWDIDADGNADGDVVVSWVRQTAGAESDDLVEAVFRPADRPWGPVEVVHRAKVDVEDAASVTAVGIGADSAVTLAWREQLSTGGDLFNHPLRAATRAPTGVWSPPRTLTSRCDAYGVQVSVNARGDAMVVCAWSTLYRGRIVGIQRPVGAAWADPAPVTRSLGGFEGDWLSHSSVLSGSGEALVRYQSTRSRAIWSKSATVR